MHYRLAKPEDAAEIAAMHAISWRQTYPGFLPESWIDRQTYNYRKRCHHWADFIAGPSNLSMWIAETDTTREGGLAGFASWRAARDEALSGYAELSSIYLLRAFQGQKIGAELFCRGQADMQKLGYEKQYCWTLEHGPSRNFYERMGLTFQGRTKTRDWDGKLITEIAMEGVMPA